MSSHRDNAPVTPVPADGRRPVLHHQDPGGGADHPLRPPPRHPPHPQPDQRHRQAALQPGHAECN